MVSASFFPHVPRVWACALSAAILGGCAGFGQVPPTSAVKPVETYDVGDRIRDVQGGPDLAPQWWRDFHDAALDRLVDDARASAPTLTVVRERVNEALARTDVERAAGRPQIDGSLSVTPTRFPGSYKIPPPAAGHWQTDTQVLAGLSFDLDLAGRIDATVRAASRRADEQAALERGASLALETALVATYLELARDWQLRQIAEDTLAQHRALLRLTDQRVAAGLDMRMASLRAAEPIPLAESELAGYDADIAVLRDRLAVLAGRGPGYTATLVPAPAVLDVQAQLPRALPADLIARRPDVAAAKADVEAKTAQIDVARAAFYPDIDLLAFAGWQSLGLRALLSGNSASLGVGPALTLPIFEGGRLRANLRAQVAVYNEAVAQYDDTVVRALAQISDTLATIATQRKQRDFTHEALTRAQSSYDLETRRYEHGVSGYLDVLLAQNRLHEDRAAYAQAQSALLISHVQLIGALGGAVTQNDKDVQ
ncbi:efflux transporter outer membrane subunit [Trinickia fusca]|uniref:Efflux transporter outer membrane subunit n=1 Tax=Trinickia fusca TaxID=2419777 RepID=A0A494XCU2_9BURK|nr:efflux transporter outer membrane subunit [Trinickia fusca]RKP48318.1 efflux transporter outer membrane subunit [Trinickia fusca]